MVNPDIAAKILQYGKQLAPDRFAQPNAMTVQAWSQALDREYPPQLWAEAVLVWSTQMVGEKMCTPRDILEAARHVAARWESGADPAKRAALLESRAQLLERNHLRNVAGYKPGTLTAGAANTVEKVDPAEIQRFQQQLKQVRDKKHDL